MGDLRVTLTLTRKQLWYLIKPNYNKAKSMKLSPESPIIVVNGRHFIYTCEEDLNEQGISQNLEKALEEIVWCSYRNKIRPAIVDSGLTSDAGFGCMIRSGQMLFCEILQRILGEYKDYSREAQLSRILKSMHDNHRGSEAPFSIHNIVSLASREFGIAPGEWFRSTSITMALQMLNKEYKPKSLRNLELLTFVDSTIYVNRLYNAVFSNSESDPEVPKKAEKPEKQIEVIKDSYGNVEEFVSPKMPVKAEQQPSDGLSL